MNRSGLLRRIVPAAVSIGLLSAMVIWVSPAGLFAAARELDWRSLLFATGAMVVALYLWDAACLPAVYRVAGRRISYGQALHLRGLTYLGGALNYELGQAALAWGMARLQHSSLARMFTRSVLLAYHDIVVLLGMGLAGSLLTDDPRVAVLRPYIAIGFAVSLLFGALVWALPTRYWRRLKLDRAGMLLEGWSAARSLRLLPLRLVYFGILVTYGAAAVAICELPISREVVVSTVPLAVLADGLPSIAGLGTRETSLMLMLSPGDSSAVLLAMSLFWSAGMIVGRVLIALAHLWGHYVFGWPELKRSDST